LFNVCEDGDRLSLDVVSDDGAMRVTVSGQVANHLPAGSVFGSLAEASQFFETGTLGYSVTSDPGRYDGIELRCKSWQVTPLHVDRLESTFFDDLTVFTPGSATFDCALLMRGIEHEWHSREDLCRAAAGSKPCLTFETPQHF
jgi:hypothetical protein